MVEFETDETEYKLSLRDLCERVGWDFIDLGQQLTPPVTNAVLSRWSRGLRSMPQAYRAQIAELLHKPESHILLAVKEGARRHQLRQEYLQKVAASGASAAESPKRARQTRHA